jgi:hypothetical protein
MTTYTWVGGGGSLDDPSNWSVGDVNPPPPPLPVPNDTAIFGSPVGTLIGSLDAEDVDFQSPTFVLQCQITAGDLTLESGKLILLAGTTINTATAEFIGASGDAGVEQYGGSNTLSDLVENVSAGSYLLTSGTLTIVGDGLEFVGAGEGDFSVSGGTVSITTGATGSNNSAGPVIVGDSGSGVFNQTNGQVTFGGNLIVGNGATGSGLVLLNG